MRTVMKGGSPFVRPDRPFCLLVSGRIFFLCGYLCFHSRTAKGRITYQGLVFFGSFFNEGISLLQSITAPKANRAAGRS